MTGDPFVDGVLVGLCLVYLVARARRGLSAYELQRKLAGDLEAGRLRHWNDWSDSGRFPPNQ